MTSSDIDELFEFIDIKYVAYAECGNLDYFITVDRILINATSRVKDLKIKVINPIEFIMEVM